MSRKKRSDSVADDVQSFSLIADEVGLPNGVEFDDEEERLIWSQFTKTRSKDSWRDFDLVLLTKIVKIESRIRKHQLEIDKMGAIIENQRGTPIENPLFRVVDTLQRQQMAIIRSMSLNQTASDPRTLNATGSKVKQAQSIVSSFEEDLIPRAGALN